MNAEPKRRRARPFRRIRKSAARWSRQLAIQVGLLPPPADRGYMICATPRSGSGYLCDLLASTRMLGNPLEYFNTKGRRLTDPGYPGNPAAQLEIVRSRGATGNGIYGVKLLVLQLKRLEGRIDPFRDLPKLSLIRLRRRDRLGQAISLVRAMQTQQFASSQPQSGVASYDAARIRRCLRSLEEQEARWDHILRRLGAAPLEFIYEDVLRDPQAAINRIAALMGLTAPAPIDRALVSYKVQRDESSTEWRARFLSETGDEFLHFAAAF